MQKYQFVSDRTVNDGAIVTMAPVQRGRNGMATVVVEVPASRYSAKKGHKLHVSMDKLVKV